MNAGRPGLSLTPVKDVRRPKPLIIRAALMQLSVRHRHLIYLSYYLGWSTARIAIELNTTDRIVKLQLRCALRALRRILRERETTAHR